MNPIVKTKQGYVRGLRMEHYCLWRGVPYAQPPVGSLRFLPPELPMERQGVLDCFAFRTGPVQHQPRKGSFYQKEFYYVDRKFSEDCLYVNIWKPLQHGHCPVMVWFHGGGFGGGSADELPFDGSAFARNGCMLVTVGFRLNLFGAFCYPDSPYVGNLGLYDALAALTWLQDNIEAFGGDKTNVTVFGQSAGGALVESLMACRQADGLYHKAILQSTGGIRSISGVQTTAMQKTFWKRLLNANGLTLNDWLSLEPQELMERTDAFRQNDDSINYYPAVDGVLLTETTGEAIHNGHIPAIPYMTGSVEGDYFFDILDKKDTLQDQRLALTQRFPLMKALPSLQTQTDLPEFHRVLHRLCVYGSPISFAKACEEHGIGPVYVYGFDHLVPGTKDCRGFHSCELWYVFGTLHRSWRPYTHYDRLLSDFFVKSWCTFAATGVPDGGHAVYWAPYCEADPFLLMIGDQGFSKADWVMDDVFVSLLAQCMIEHEIPD